MVHETLMHVRRFLRNPLSSKLMNKLYLCIRSKGKCGSLDRRRNINYRPLQSLTDSLTHSLTRRGLRLDLAAGIVHAFSPILNQNWWGTCQLCLTQVSTHRPTLSIQAAITGVLRATRRKRGTKQNILTYLMQCTLNLD